MTVADQKRTAAPVGGSVKTFQAVSDAQNGRTSGFDLMRIMLAAAVIVVHSVPVAYGQDPNMEMWGGDFRPLVYGVLPMFFALSGYLVTGSLERTPKLHRFLGLRAIRLVPALAVETLLCAVLVGAAVTTLPLEEYFTHWMVRDYFWNIVGHVHYYLPGVFQDLPAPAVVNVSLWTVPYELECYLVLAILAIVGIAKNRWLLLAAVGVFCAVAPFVIETPELLERPVGRMLVLCFLCGVLMYKFRDKIPHNALLFFAALAGALLLFRGQQFAFWGAPLAAYVTVYLGLMKAPHIPVLMDGDYSYGLYLFAFPLQQLQAYMFPNAHEWYWNASFALVAGLAYAAFSWHVIEKPILSKRNVILNTVDAVFGKAFGAVRRLLPSKETAA